jgi:hypothetical protein
VSKKVVTSHSKFNLMLLSGFRDTLVAMLALFRKAYLCIRTRAIHLDII